MFSAKDLNDQLALEEYVAAVQSVDADAFGVVIILIPVPQLLP